MNNELKIVGPIAAVVVIILSVVIYLAVRSGAGTPPPVATPATDVADAGQIVRPESHSRGATNAKVVVVEFGDFQCPACKAAEPVVEQLVQQYQGQSVSFVFRNFPLSQHANAQLAANAAEAAADQGKYWEMHDLLYIKQDEWAQVGRTQATNYVVDYATQVGVKDTGKFRTAVEQRSFNNVLAKDLADAVALDLQQTPSFFVNGKAVESVGAIEAAIQAGLAQ